MSEHTEHKKHEKKCCVATKAYELWEKDGRKQGQDLNYWLTAEKAVQSHPKSGSEATDSTRR